MNLNFYGNRFYSRNQTKNNSLMKKKDAGSFTIGGTTFIT